MRIAVLDNDAAQLKRLVELIEHQVQMDDGPVSCTPFDRGEDLRQALRSETFDLLVLEWNMPDFSGMELLAWLRRLRESTTPVVMLSSRNSERDVAYALGMGADDYMSKPFRPLELAARIRRLLTWTHPGSNTSMERFGAWLFDRTSSSVQFRAADAKLIQHVSLSDCEFRMALALFRNIGRPVSRAHLLSCTGREGENAGRALDSQIYRLRAKLGLQAARGIQLHTVYGQGYRLEHASPVAPHSGPAGQRATATQD